MFSKEMEALIEATLEDGVLTDQEKNALIRRAQKEGIDVDELDIYIQSLLQKRKRMQEENEIAQERSTKMGSVKKCPNCGHPVKLGDAACPSCGHAFNTSSSSEQKSSLEKLMEKLDEVNQKRSGLNLGAYGRAFGFDKSSERKMDIISNFPVPNNRADLLDFLSSVQPKANKKGPKGGRKTYGNYDEDFGLAYWNLYVNCINKARISFANDEAFQYFFDFYEKENSKKGFFARLFGK